MSPGNPISVIIRTSNSARPLRILLRRFKTAADDEIIVVDTGSKDATVDLAERAGAKVIRNREPFNYSRTLNLGFREAKNNWLLVLSVHCPPVNEDFLERYREALAQLPETPAVVYGLQLFSRRQYAQIDKSVKICKGAGSKHQVAGGGNSNALYSREAWLRHPFDERLKTGEDLEWRNWAAGAGFLSVAAPEACVYYRHMGGPIYRFRKACDEVRVRGADVRPMSFVQLGLGVAQATRQLLWEETAVRPWIGQLAHQFGVFVASRKQRPFHPQ